MEERNKNKNLEKMDAYFDESINSNSYRQEQTKERLNMRKQKVFNLLFSKRKDYFHNNVNGPNEIDINSLKCNESIKQDVNEYLKTEYDIKTWFKFIFSSNKNNVYLALFLLRRYIELQILEIKEDKRVLSRNDTELIQKLVDYLLNDDLRISYNSCACLTNLTLFPIHIEKRLYNDKNLEKILQFFNMITKNISAYTYKTLLLFMNISTNQDVKVYLMKHDFIKTFYEFITNIINGNIKFINDLEELNTIKFCIRILYQLILVCELDENYMKYFIEFIPYVKIITTKYFVNIDNIAFDEEECMPLINLWQIYTNKFKEDELISEIIKDNFTQILIKFYKKLKNADKKINFVHIFCYLSFIDAEHINIIINDGLFSLLSEEIEKYQYSNVKLLAYLILTCSNFALGNVGVNKLMLQLGIIYKVMDITIFYIDDKLDNEIIILLRYCLSFIINHISGLDNDSRKQIIIYKNSLVNKIFCKALKLDLKDFMKDRILEKIINIINELNVVSEEIDEEKEKIYDVALISNSLVDILNNLYNKPYFDNLLKESILQCIDFIKDKEKYI